MTQSLDGVTLPSSWKWTQLRHVTTVIRRGTAPIYADEGSVRVVGQVSNRNGQIDWQKTRFHHSLKGGVEAKGLLRPGDVIVNSTGTGTLGRVGYFASRLDEKPCMVDGHITLVRTRDDELDSRFAYYYLSSVPFQSFMMSTLVTGSTNQIELSADRMGSSPVPLPELEEQRRIADFLDAELGRDERLRLHLKQLLLRLDERAAVCRHDCVTGRNLGVSMYDSGNLGQFPQNWPLVPLRKLTSRVGVGVVVEPSSYYSDSGVPFLRGSNVRNGYIDVTEVKRMSLEDSRRLWRSQLSSGDVVVVRAGYPGRAAVVPASLDGANCASLLIVKRSEVVRSDFLATFFNCAVGQAQVDLVRYGAAQEQINVGHVVNFMVPFPSLKEQDYLLADLRLQLAAIDAAAVSVNRQLAVLEERPKSLIAAAVTGKFDVSTVQGGV